MSLGDVDFLGPKTARSAGWWLLAAGVAALGAALWCDQQWSVERAAAQHLAQARAEARRALLTPPPVAPPSARERRVRQAQRELDRPWLAALREVEATTRDPIYLLSLSFERTGNSIKVEGEAPSFDHAMAYAQMLGNSDALSSPLLVSHEQITDPLGRSLVRFAVIAHWGRP